MKKNKLFSLISILILLSLFGTAAICNQCAITPTTETTTSSTTTSATEIPSSETTVAETTAGITAETSSKETTVITATETTAAPTETPIINLEIYEGPTYSAADNVCYYRIKATVTGNPSPTISFNKDDSGGAWGADRVQINIHTGESYNLIAVAKSMAGVASDSMLLTWGCSEAPATTVTSDSTDTTPTPATYNVIIHPFDIGYIVPPTGINNDSAIIGDSISNTNVRGFFALNLSSLKGKNIINVELELKTSKFWGDPSFKGDICIIYDNYIPLDSSDYDTIGWVATTYGFANNTEPLRVQGESIKLNVKGIANGGYGIMSFVILYENDDSNGNFQIDGREFTKESISLKVTYTE